MGRLGMIRRRLTAVVGGYVIGVVATAVGAGMQWGPGIGLIVGGVATAGSCLTLVSVSEDDST